MVFYFCVVPECLLYDKKKYKTKIFQTPQRVLSVYVNNYYLGGYMTKMKEGSMRTFEN